MKFEQLCRRLNKNLNRNEWHQHKTGQGWVQNTATVSSYVYVGLNCIIFDKAVVRGNVNLYDYTMIGGNATVIGSTFYIDGFFNPYHPDIAMYDYSKIYGNAQVKGQAQLFDCAEVFGNALLDSKKVPIKIGNNAKVFGNSTITGDVILCHNAQVYDNAYIRSEHSYISLRGSARICKNTIVNDSIKIPRFFY